MVASAGEYCIRTLAPSTVLWSSWRLNILKWNELTGREVHLVSHVSAGVSGAFCSSSIRWGFNALDGIKAPTDQEDVELGGYNKCGLWRNERGC